MNMIEIERALRELRLSGIAETLSTRVMQAQAAQQPFLETFAAMLQDELDRRRSRLTERRFKRSGLTERLSLADFDWRFNPKLPRSACFDLHTLKFIGEGPNALIIGKSGTGKSDLTKAVAYQATLQGYDVRYVEADTEFASYGLASTQEKAEKLKAWIEPDLLVLDDLFLARRIADVSAELLQAITSRPDRDALSLRRLSVPDGHLAATRLPRATAGRQAVSRSMGTKRLILKMRWLLAQFSRIASLLESPASSWPTNGSAHWSLRTVATETGISKSSVARYPYPARDR